MKTNNPMVIIIINFTTVLSGSDMHTRCGQSANTCKQKMSHCSNKSQSVFYIICKKEPELKCVTFVCVFVCVCVCVCVCVLFVYVCMNVCVL